VYLVPKDEAFHLNRLRLQVQAVEDVRRWYASQLGGPTFHAEPMVVHQSRHTFRELADSNFQQWWPLLEAEFAEIGYSWHDSAEVKLLFLAQAAGGWAGGDSENGGIESIAQAGRVPAGAWGGQVVIGDSSVAGVLAGVCPMDGRTGATVWWCNWDTYRGTIAHELGHTWGIPHPDAFKRGPGGESQSWDCQEDGNTVMQCHWGFPYDSLLTYEVEHFRSLRFFAPRPDPPFTLLADLLPAAVEGPVSLRRLGTAAIERLAVAWVDDPARGSSTGYPWAVLIGAGGHATWRLDGACATLLAAVGRAREGGGRGTAWIEVDGAQAATLPLTGGRAIHLEVPICGHLLTLGADGEERFQAVFGNARLLPHP
jgi:hypothetical protein